MLNRPVDDCRRRTVRSRYLSVAVVLLLAMGSALCAADDDGIMLRGPLEQGALVTGRVAPGTQLFLDGMPVRTTSDGDFVIGFGRDANASSTLLAFSPDGTKTERQLRVRQRKYPVERIKGVPERTVEPPADQTQRIIDEQQEVQNAHETDSDGLAFLGPFRWPLVGPITGVYGSQRVYNGKAVKQLHFGVDIAAPKGTPVRAPADGTVTLAEPDLFFWGGTVIIDHGYGVSSTLLHLSRLFVKVGDSVRAGQIVGDVGATGRASAPHLEWRMNWYDVHIDPRLVAPPMPAQATPSLRRVKSPG